MLGDELDVVPAEPGAVDLRAEHVLEIAPREPRIDTGGFPVDRVLSRGRLARRAAERGGERSRDDLDSLARREARRFRGDGGRIGAVPDGEDQFLAHHAAKLAIDEI